MLHLRYAKWLSQSFMTGLHQQTERIYKTGKRQKALYIYLLSATIDRLLRTIEIAEIE